jgi:hypothetical protein
MQNSVIIFTSLIVICLDLNAQIKVLSDGKVGIGTINPTVPFEVHSNANYFSFVNTGSYDAPTIVLDRYMTTPRFYPYSNHVGTIGLNSNFWQYAYIDKMYYMYSPTYYSDQKFKKNIAPITTPLDKVLKLNGVKYDLDFSSIGINSDMDMKHGKNQLGLVAQEVQKIIPEIVTSDSNGLGICYIELIPLLIEAIKEQNTKIVELEATAKNQTKSAKVILPSNRSSATLAQNVPNPFNENTTIGFYLPATVQNAIFCIYDLQGKQLKSIKIIERENGSVTINGSELFPGMYYYSLIADGYVVGTEKMILTD